MKTLREKLDEVNGSFRKLQGYYIFLNGSQEDYCKARSREEAAKTFAKAYQRLTGKKADWTDLIDNVTPESKTNHGMEVQIL